MPQGNRVKNTPFIILFFKTWPIPRGHPWAQHSPADLQCCLTWWPMPRPYGDGLGFAFDLQNHTTIDLFRLEKTFQSRCPLRLLFSPALLAAPRQTYVPNPSPAPFGLTPAPQCLPYSEGPKTELICSVASSPVLSTGAWSQHPLSPPELPAFFSVFPWFLQGTKQKLPVHPGWFPIGFSYTTQGWSAPLPSGLPAWGMFSLLDYLPRDFVT